jgi:hypothetical protein
VDALGNPIDGKGEIVTDTIQSGRAYRSRYHRSSAGEGTASRPV